MKCIKVGSIRKIEKTGLSQTTPTRTVELAVLA